MNVISRTKQRAILEAICAGLSLRSAARVARVRPITARALVADCGGRVEVLARATDLETLLDEQRRVVLR